MNRSRYCLMLTLVAALFAVGPACARSAERTESLLPSNVDIACGPRSVYALLKHYGRGEDLELLQIVRELQWPKIENGSDLASLAAYLEKHGVHTRTIELAPDAEVCWSEPVIAHLNPENSGDQGHFMVWIPSSSSMELRVDGAPVGFACPQADLSPRMSGVVLLTSGQEISEERMARVCRISPSFATGAMATAAPLIGMALIFQTIWRRRRKSTATFAVEAVSARGV